MSDQVGTADITILIIGRTGNGKSTLGNVIMGSSKFKESEFAVSETKNYQRETIESDGIKLHIVDTIGIGDTQLSTKEVLFKIADACYTIRDGINQVLFVTSGRFTEEEVLAYDLLRSVIFNNDIVKYTTIVRTRFPAFRNPDKCQEDINKMLQENSSLSQVIRTCNKVVHVNNMTADEDPQLSARGDSRLKLLLHLRGCTQIYRPKELDDLNGKIESFQTEKEKLEVRIQQIDQQLQETSNLNAQLAAQLENEKKEGEKRITALKEAVATQTGRQVREKSPGLFEIVGLGLDKLTRKCSIQ